ncbi:DNA sulfur modification protein DndB [Erysipelothrix anatis]|uniref:DNA sulfur modification protein DndB n=1 Tax=Erysipelothrix anatis TaxID=2683713 RepID=UPI00135A598C|nr:DNA sulfur modification protein DndB [Erysipelothrix anatis]
MELKQSNKLSITTKTVGWLVENYYIDKFEPHTMSGYQREIDRKHCQSIINYVGDGTSFYFPSSIVAAKESDDDGRLRIVDGQHRIEAFKIIKLQNPEVFQKIEDKELPVIVLISPDKETEMETFITINKTSKKVDTSLATVIKMLSAGDTKDDRKSKIAYISVETAYVLNYRQEELNQDFNTKYSNSLRIWDERIAFEGQTTRTRYTITLNAFVREISRLVSILESKNYLDFNWSESTDAFTTKVKFMEFFLHLWDEIYKKWPELFNEDGLDNRRIIQGGIGLGAIFRVLTREIKTRIDTEDEMDDIAALVTEMFNHISLPNDVWMPNTENSFSRYSSGSGYAYIASEILSNMRSNGYGIN